MYTNANSGANFKRFAETRMRNKRQRREANNEGRIILESNATLAVVASYCVAVCAPQQAVAAAAVANKEDSGEEHQAADGAGLALQEEADQVERHEHYVGLQQRRVHGFWYQ